MDHKIQEAANVPNQTFSPDQVRNIAFIQELEDFALNSTLSILSDSTLWYISPNAMPLVKLRTFD
jgi:hypothetical protein